MELEKRRKRFLVELDQILQENVDCYIDEQGEPIECPNDEQTIYNWIMDKEEYHLLTRDYVQNIIHVFMTDFKKRMEILREKELL